MWVAIVLLCVRLGTADANMHGPPGSGKRIAYHSPAKRERDASRAAAFFTLDGSIVSRGFGGGRAILQDADGSLPISIGSQTVHTREDISHVTIDTSSASMRSPRTCEVGGTSPLGGGSSSGCLGGAAAAIFNNLEIPRGASGN